MGGVCINADFLFYLTEETVGRERLSSEEQGEHSEQTCPGGVPGVTLLATFLLDPGAEHTTQTPGAVSDGTHFSRG